jgi:TonB-linked SusC/RagA family outer membrane protein
MKFYLLFNSRKFATTSTPRVMKLILIMLAAFFLQASTALAQKITLKKKNVPLVEIFKDIRQQTGYDFVYTTQQIEIAKKITINVKDASLADVLKVCFDGQPFTFAIEEKTIVVKSKPRVVNTTPAQTQTQLIKGRVVDSQGQPLPSVTVWCMERQKYTISSLAGEFSILADQGSTLRFTYVGYKQLMAKVVDQSFLNISLTTTNVDLGEIVVVGYGQVKKENLTTAVSTINADQIVEMPTSNLSQVFAGRLPGMLVRTSSGIPGGETANLLVRTTNSAEAPLLVIDGVPRFNTNNTGTSTEVNLSFIDPNEVESITVLKDNAATAVYGSRGANGVIIVTTKRGKIGKPQFNYTGNYTFSSPGKLVKNLDSYGYAVEQNEIYTNSGLAAPYSASVLDTIKRQLNPYKYANSNWAKVLLDNQAFVQNHSLNVNGGSEAIKYFILGNYTDQGGLYPTSSFKRYTFQNNLDIKLSRDFKAQINLGYRYGNQNLPSGGDPVNTALNASPLTPIYNANGTFGSAPAGSSYNPLAVISPQSGYAYTKNNYLTGNGRLTYESSFIKGLSAYGNFDIEKNFQRAKTYVVPVPLYRLDPTSPTGYTQTGGTGKPSLTDATADYNTYTQDLALNYKRDFGKHSIDVLALYTLSEAQSNTNSDTRLNLVAPGLDILNLGSTVGETTTGSRTQTAREGYVGRINYAFDKKILIEGSFRYDGSTYFAPGHRWGFFPGGSAAWIISKENFFQELLPVVSSLKLRGSIGLTGDDNISSYTYYYTYGIANTGVQNTRGYIFGTTYAPSFYQTNSTLPNEDITWAKNRQENLGFDAELWHGRLGITFDIYQKDRYDMLMSQTYNLPATFGIGGPIQNFARLRNKGFEVDLNSQNRFNNDWSLNLNANFTLVHTKVLDYGTKNLPSYQQLEGYSTNTLVGYHAVGIFQNAAQIAAWPTDQDGLKNATIKPGDVKYADMNGDGKLTAADQITVDNYGFPPINFGFGFTVKYKNFSLATLFNGALGGYIKYATNPNWQFTYDNAWRPGNEDAKYPRLGSSANNSLASDATLIKDNFLRLRDLRLGFDLPTKWTEAIKIKHIKVFAEGSNLLTWTSVLGGIDPETPNLGTQGATGGFYPNQKNIGFGVNVNF